MDTPTPVQTRPDTDERLEALARISGTEVYRLTLADGAVTYEQVDGHLGDLRFWAANTQRTPRGSSTFFFLDDKPISWVDLVGIVAADRAGDPTDDLRYAQASDF